MDEQKIKVICAETAQRAFTALHDFCTGHSFVKTFRADTSVIIQAAFCYKQQTVTLSDNGLTDDFFSATVTKIRQIRVTEAVDWSSVDCVDAVVDRCADRINRGASRDVTPACAADSPSAYGYGGNLKAGVTEFLISHVFLLL